MKVIDQGAWEANEGKQKRINRYRCLANLEEDFVIDENNLDDWALTRVCRETNCPKERVKSELLER